MLCFARCQSKEGSKSKDKKLKCESAIFAYIFNQAISTDMFVVERIDGDNCLLLFVVITFKYSLIHSTRNRKRLPIAIPLKAA